MDINELLKQNGVVDGKFGASGYDVIDLVIFIYYENGDCYIGDSLFADLIEYFGFEQSKKAMLWILENKIDADDNKFKELIDSFKEEYCI